MWHLISLALVLLVTALPGAATSQDNWCGDVNDDGAVNFIDGRMILLAQPLMCPAQVQFPASGQTTAYPADKLGNPNAAVPDDGTVQAGAPLRYRDNGDGTITDLNTQLMWEKKVAADAVPDSNNLHDIDNFYPWSDPNSITIWDWLDQVNAEGGTGFAGYSDWRIPNIRELQSIVDYGQLDPAMDPAFHGVNCGGACTDLTDPACSCAIGLCWWSSTTARSCISPCEPEECAWYVYFFHGEVNCDREKSLLCQIRAVRGP